MKQILVMYNSEQMSMLGLPRDNLQFCTTSGKFRDVARGKNQGGVEVLGSKHVCELNSFF